MERAPPSEVYLLKTRENESSSSVGCENQNNKKKFNGIFTGELLLLPLDRLRYINLRQREP